MKQKYFFIFIFFYLSLNICKAQDSLFFFKAAVGVNWGNWISLPNNKPRYLNQGHGGGSTQDTIYKYNTSTSPTFNVRIAIRLNRAAGFKLESSFFISEKYNYSSREYVFNYSGWALAPPTYTTVVNYSSQIKHIFFMHQYTSSMGLQIKIKKIYWAPVKIDFTYSAISEAITSTSASSPEKVENKKTDELLYGFGTFLGYDFKIKKINLFIEYQFDYHKVHSVELKQFNHSLSLGFKF